MLVVGGLLKSGGFRVDQYRNETLVDEEYFAFRFPDFRKNRSRVRVDSHSPSSSLTRHPRSSLRVFEVSSRYIACIVKLCRFQFLLSTFKRFLRKQAFHFFDFFDFPPPLFPDF